MRSVTFTPLEKVKAARRPVFALSLLLMSLLVSAQKNITGVVRTASDAPVSEVSVQVKGTSRGTITNAKGEFSIPANTGETLVFSAVGFGTIEKKIGNDNTINVSLTEGAKELGEVVVTALGIKREQMALGYATQSINENQMTDARSNNWASALSGKVAGLNLSGTGSGPSGSVRINLRGDRSLLANQNEALIIVDGVPINSRMSGSSVSEAYNAGSGNDVPVDFGNGIADINPDDIESISVLKGPGATALYGSRAANGALIITTKSGSKKTKGIGVTLNSNYSINTVLKWPDYQYEYGQGVGKTFTPAANLYYSYGASPDGASTSGTSSAFGPPFRGQQYFQYDPATEKQSATRLPWAPHNNNITDFWQHGSTFTNSISLEGGNNNGTMRASVTHSKNEWIMPNTGFERITVALSGNQKISEKIRLNAKVNYTNKTSDNLPATGYNNQSIAYFMIFQNPNVDLEWYRPMWKKGKEQLEQIHPFSSFIDNPFLIAHEMLNSQNNHNIIATVSGNYSITKNLEFMLRSGVNYSTDERKQRRPYNTANFAQGYYRELNITKYEINSDALLTYKTSIGDRFSVSASAGGNLLRSRYNATNAYINGLVTPGVYKLSNGLYDIIFKPSHSNYDINSVYGFANFSYDDKIFLDVTGRNDWSSTLPKNNWSFFYPSVNTSFILSKLLPLPRQISYAKLRASYAQVGNGTQPYSTLKYYLLSDFPSSATADNTLYNTTLKPEISTSYELGLEMKFLKNRLGFDVGVYRTFTKNQIIPIRIDQSTGYAKAIVNAGEIKNQGVEVVLNGSPVKNKDFQWNTTITWSANRSKVLELAEELGGDKQQVIGTSGNASIIAEVGGQMGDIWGFGFVRTPDGQIVYKASDGLPERPATIQKIGNAYADWRGGIFNEFVYKNFRFNFLIDGQKGGMVYSQTHHKMMEQGKLKKSLPGREEGFIIGEGVVADGAGFKPNAKKVTVGDYYADYYRRANVESNTFDASFIKLREVRLEYSIPAKVTGKLKLQQVSVALYGRDLAMITDFPVFDPETASLNGDTILPGAEIGQLPSTRTIGVNLNIKF
jgi:TonB-linked SusC/RagA family outer membrane protein